MKNAENSMKTLIAVLLLLLSTGTSMAEIKTEVIEYKVGDAVLQGYLAYDTAGKGKAPGVLVVHDWLGLSDYTKMRVEMLAKLGYVAFAADVYGKGIRPANAQEAQAEAGKFYGNRGAIRERLKAALKVLSERPETDASREAVIGYCFGGMCALELARSGAPLNAVVTFHGSLTTPTPADAKNIKGKVLVLHGADDPYVKPEDVKGFMEEMKSGGVDYQIVQYGGAVHSFTDKRAGSDNSKGAAYNEKADVRSWRAMQDFFAETLGASK
jgi:dienelactone hydrolase